MEDARNLLMQPDNAEPSSPLGGLASQAMGGLSKFANNVNKGIEAVLSHPLYARAWSGMVSAQTGDPMAGPMALQQLQQNALDQRYQKTQMQREEEAYTTEKQNAMLRAKQIRDLQAAMARGDRAGVQAALTGFAPAKGAEMFLNPPSPKAPTQRKLQLPDGRVQQQSYMDGQWTNDGEPGKPASLVNVDIVGNGPEWQPVSGLIDRYRKEADTYLAGIETVPRLRELAAQDNAAADMQLIYAIAKARDPGSVVREGEVDFAKASGSKVEELAQSAKEITKSGKLSPAMRARIIGSLETDIRAQVPAEQARRERYRGYANTFQVPYELLFPETDSVEAQLRRAGIGLGAEAPAAPATPVRARKLP